MEAKEEGRLIALAKQEPEAFRQIYRHYAPRVYGYIAARVGRVPEAEDLTADVFLRVVENLDGFEYRGAGSFAAWVFRIASNRVAGFYRENQAHTLVPLESLPEIQWEGLSPDSVVTRKERFAQLYQHIQSLAPRHQEVITLKYFGGLRNKEIAAVLGLGERTVAAYLCRAIEGLERLYQEVEQHE